MDISLTAFEYPHSEDRGDHAWQQVRHLHKSWCLKRFSINDATREMLLSGSVFCRLLNLTQTPLQPLSFPGVGTGLIILNVFFFSAVNSSPLNPDEVMMSINKSAFILPHWVWLFPKSFKHTRTDTNPQVHLFQECLLQLTIPILISLAQQIGKTSFLETSPLKNHILEWFIQIPKGFQ